MAISIGAIFLFQKLLSGDVLKNMCLKNFAKLAGNYLYQVCFWIKLQAEDLQIYLKEIALQVFFFVYWEVVKNAFFKEDIQVTSSVLHRMFLCKILDRLITSL